MYGYPYVLVSRGIMTNSSPYRFERQDTDTDGQETSSRVTAGILVAYLVVIGIVVALLAFAGTGDSAANEQAIRPDTGCYKVPGIWSGCLPRK